MSKTAIRFTLIASLLALFALSCNALSGVGDDISQIRGTAGAVITQAQGFATQGGAVVGTARAFATENPGMVETAQAFVEEHGEAAVGTVSAFATENPGLLETAQAYVTQEGSQLIETARAIATQRPGAAETARAVVTQGSQPEGAPADIPLVNSAQIDEFFANAGLVSYIVSMDFQQVVDFYIAEMPENGWTAVSEGTIMTEAVAVLNYAKDDRHATVTITNNPLSDQTVVLATVEGP